LKSGIRVQVFPAQSLSELLLVATSDIFTPRFESRGGLGGVFGAKRRGDALDTIGQRSGAGRESAKFGRGEERGTQNERRQGMPAVPEYRCIDRRKRAGAEAGFRSTYVAKTPLTGIGAGDARVVVTTGDAFEFGVAQLVRLLRWFGWQQDSDRVVRLLDHVDFQMGGNRPHLGKRCREFLGDRGLGSGEQCLAKTIVFRGLRQDVGVDFFVGRKLGRHR
jgi:hypothetical protein